MIKKIFQELQLEAEDAQKRRMLETPGEREARLRREMDTIYKEVADMDQIKYEVEEFKEERVRLHIIFWIFEIWSLWLDSSVIERSFSDTNDNL